MENGSTNKLCSTTDTKFLDQSLIAAFIGALEIVKKLATLGHKLQQSPSRVIVLTCVLKCSVRLLMRSGRIPTCTSGDPVSPAFLACALMTSDLRSAVIDIVNDLPVGRLCPAVRRG